MFSLYLTKMNVYIDECDVSKINPSLLNMMNYLQSYLDKDWVIKKRNSCYILTKNNDKILISDNIHISNSLPATIDKQGSGLDITRQTEDANTIRILYFLYNVLNNKWTIKKTFKNEYIFIKKHEGKKEIFSKKYLHTFLKENFNSNLIK
jgi:hypothetical protein